MASDIDSKHKTLYYSTDSVHAIELSKTSFDQFKCFYFNNLFFYKINWLFEEIRRSFNLLTTNRLQNAVQRDSRILFDRSFRERSAHTSGKFCLAKV